MPLPIPPDTCIALDGLPLQVRSAGIGQYTAALVGAMARRRPDLRFVLFGMTELARIGVRAAPGAAPLSMAPNIRWRRSTVYPLVTGYPLPLPRLVPLRPVLGRVDLYHATNYAAPRTAGVPLVVTVHDLTLLREPALGTPALRRLVARAAQAARTARRVIADSEATRRDVLELLGLPPDRVHAVPLGCDPRFTPGERAEAREVVARAFGIDAPFVLHVGTIEPRKNLDRLIAAFGRARDAERLPHRLVLAGAPGWGIAPVQAAIARERLGAVVQLTGAVSADQLLALYRAADLFVFPSRYEGFGLPALEAMACGAPVVAASTGALPEVVGEAALSVDPRDTDALAAAIARALTDADLRARLRVAGPERAARFSWERCAAETLAVYEEALA